MNGERCCVQTTSPILTTLPIPSVIAVAPALDVIPISTTLLTMTTAIRIMTLWTNLAACWDKYIRPRHPMTKMTSLPGTGPSLLEAIQVFLPAPFLGNIIHLHSLVHSHLSERPQHSSPRHLHLLHESIHRSFNPMVEDTVQHHYPSGQ